VNILTIGHSNHSWKTFASLLPPQGIKVLVDVRSRPVSRSAPFATRRRLPELLRGVGARYVFMGESLGGRPSDPDCYDAIGKPDYAKIRAKPWFQEGIEELVKLPEESRVVIMCV